MKSQRQAVNVALYASLGLVLVAMFLPYGSALRAWLALVGFTITGLLFAAGLTTMARRSGLAFGAYMFVCGASFSVPHLWTPRPQWWDTVTISLMLLVVVWFAVQSIIDRRRADTVA